MVLGALCLGRVSNGMPAHAQNFGSLPSFRITGDSAQQGCLYFSCGIGCQGCQGCQGYQRHDGTASASR